MDYTDWVNAVENRVGSVVQLLQARPLEPLPVFDRLGLRLGRQGFVSRICVMVAPWWVWCWVPLRADEDPVGTEGIEC